MLIASAFESLSLFPFVGKKIAPYAKRMATTDSEQRKRVLLSATTSYCCGFRLVSFSPRGQTEEIKLSGTAASTDSISTYWILSRAISSRRPQCNVPRGVRHVLPPLPRHFRRNDSVPYNQCDWNATTFKVRHRVGSPDVLCVHESNATIPRGKLRRGESRSRNKVLDIIMNDFGNRIISVCRNNILERVCVYIILKKSWSFRNYNEI